MFIFVDVQTVILLIYSYHFFSDINKMIGNNIIYKSNYENSDLFERIQSLYIGV